MNTTTTVIETAIHIVALVEKGPTAPICKRKTVRAVATLEYWIHPYYVNLKIDKFTFYVKKKQIFAISTKPDIEEN